MDETITKEDVQSFFANAGSIIKLWVARKPPGFGFVEFEDARDAEDAIEDLDGKEIRGRVVTVQFQKSGERGGGRGDDRGRGRSNEECFNCHRIGHFARNCPDKVQ